MLPSALPLGIEERRGFHRRDHRIIEWPGLEGTSRIIKLQPLCHRQGHQPPHLILGQAAQGPIQPGLEHLQGRGIHNLSGQPVPALHHSHSKELPPDIQPKSSLLQLKTISPCLAIIYPFKKLNQVVPYGTQQQRAISALQASHAIECGCF